MDTQAKTQAAKMPESTTHETSNSTIFTHKPFSHTQACDPEPEHLAHGNLLYGREVGSPSRPKYWGFRRSIRTLDQSSSLQVSIFSGKGNHCCFRRQVRRPFLSGNLRPPPGVYVNQVSNHRAAGQLRPGFEVFRCTADPVER